ncbi:transposase family protein, partial [Streptomyces sp. NPDC057565]|uniref:transposase family protein n=1 Tax=Streptomyces sp. NPDC057565 TaxID=3346169 RepID=UPI0036CBD61E
LIIPHRRERDQAELPAWKEEHNASHRKIRTRVEHAFTRMKTWKILRDCRLKDEGVQHRSAPRRRRACDHRLVHRACHGS